jgi:hypothetical protein
MPEYEMAINDCSLAPIANRELSKAGKIPHYVLYLISWDYLREGRRL